jgi:hypothetical protein
MPQILLAQQQDAGSVGSGFGAENAVLLTTTQVITLGQGVWLVSPGGVANAVATVDYSPDSGSTWRTIIRGVADTARLFTVVFSDGFNTRISQTGTASTTTTYYTQIKAF